MRILTYFLHPLRFFAFVMGFALFGLILIYDVSVAESLQSFGNPWHFALYHAVWVAIGLGVFIVCSLIPPDWWKKLAPLMFVVAIGLLIAVLIPGVGSRVQGAQRWIRFGGFGLQPAEITKFALIIFFATWLEKHQRFTPFLFLTGIVFFLIMLQPNLSTASIVVMLAAVLFFLAGGNIKPLIGFGALGILLVGILVVAAPYRRERLLTFLNPASDPLGRSYHIRQITIALGRGGMWGQGIGLSKQKQEYVPEASSDSIFAIFAEETGLVGSLTLVTAYVGLAGIGFLTAQKQTDKFRFLVAAGITTWISLHVVLNIAAMVALVPLTGIPLPLISFGGSNLTSIMAGLGVLAGLQRGIDDEEGSAHHFPSRRHLKRRSVVRSL